jgi:hypothetical protein
MFLAIASIGLTQWATVHTKIGASLSLPSDMRLWIEVPVSAKPRVPVSSEIYSSHGGKFLVALTQRDIPKDENPKDSEATRLDYFILDEVDLPSAKFSLMRHHAFNGWPAVDFEIAHGSGSKAVLGGSTFDVGLNFGAVRYRAVRTKSKNFVVEIWGQFSDADRQRIVDSLQLPKEVELAASRSGARRRRRSR